MHQVEYILSSNKTNTSHRLSRRREQNKLNQRARRLRQRAQHTEHENTSDEPSNTPYGVLVPSRCQQQYTTYTTPIDRRRPVFSIRLPNYLVLSQLNVWQATLINSFIMGISHYFTGESDSDSDTSDAFDEADPSNTPHYISPSRSTSSSSSNNAKTIANIPSSLMPTHLQRTTPHLPWIDLIPSAGMRDSLIRASPQLDLEDFCMDMLGTMFDTSGHPTSHGLLVWGESWKVESWEMTEGFVRKWGWLLDDGCQEMLKSTNEWREKRGEDVLSFRS